MINIKATNIELTNAINKYINKSLSRIKKFAKGGEVAGFVEVGKTTNHHKQGDVYRAEIDISLRGEKFYSSSEKSDLYQAIDEVKEEIIRRITETKDKKQTLFKRGAVSVKKMIKGVSKRNPFTSKY
ncbi:MAG: ribosome-associated translation inhibitor RaiA [Candidatus Pacebacteria bacterium]|nr:ribosome-associated translation inhibitor RaiA [Candidatus Paceibacterota bacterium]